MKQGQIYPTLLDATKSMNQFNTLKQLREVYILIWTPFKVPHFRNLQTIGCLCTLMRAKSVYSYQGQICVLLLGPNLCTRIRTKSVYSYQGQVCVLLLGPILCIRIRDKDPFTETNRKALSLGDFVLFFRSQVFPRTWELF